MSMREIPVLVLAAVLLGPLVSGCMSPSGSTVEEQRASGLKMRDEALAAFYEDDPELKQQVESAPGYAVFSNFSIHPGILSFATGYGVLTNNRANRNTHLRWHRLTLGPGIAIKGLYGLAVFHDQELMENFEDGKWTAGGQIEASFIFGDFGGALEAGWIFNRQVDVYYMTHTGVALELELFGVGKVSTNSSLNAPSTSKSPEAAAGSATRTALAAVRAQNRICPTVK